MKENLIEGVIPQEFELSDTQGRTIRLSDYRGKPVVLVLLRGFT